VYNVFVYSEDEYERYLEEGSATVSGFLVERRIRELSESERISQNVYVVFENPEPDEEIRIRYRVYWAEDSDVLRRGVMFCGLGVFAIILVLVFFFKYKNWAKRKVYGWFGADDEITNDKSDVDNDKADDVDEEVERLRKRLEELENKRDGKNDGKKENG